MVSALQGKKATSKFVTLTLTNENEVIKQIDLDAKHFRQGATNGTTNVMKFAVNQAQLRAPVNPGCFAENFDFPDFARAFGIRLPLFPYQQ